MSLFLKAGYDGAEEKNGDDSELSYAEIVFREAKEEAKRKRVIESKYIDPLNMSSCLIDIKSL